MDTWGILEEILAEATVETVETEIKVVELKPITEPKPEVIISVIEEQNARQEKAKLAYTERLNKQIEEKKQLSIERRQKYIESRKSKIEIGQLMLENMSNYWTERADNLEELKRNWFDKKTN